MEQITQIIKDRTKMVTELLTQYSEFRDNDTELTLAFWIKELGENGHSFSRASFIEFMELYHFGKLTTAETIARTSRKVQRDNPELRGENWGKRKQKAKEVSQNINQI